VLLPRRRHHEDSFAMPASRSTSLDRSAAGLLRPAGARRQSGVLRTTIHGAPPNAADNQGAPPAPASTVALSDGTRISFRAVEELPELVD
jgi:hypothetical protein